MVKQATVRYGVSCRLEEQAFARCGDRAAACHEADPAWVAVIDEDHRAPTDVGVRGGGHAAEIALVAHRKQRQQVDHGVLGGVQAAQPVPACSADRVADPPGDHAPHADGGELDRRQLQAAGLDYAVVALASVADELVGDLHPADEQGAAQATADTTVEWTPTAFRRHRDAGLVDRLGVIHSLHPLGGRDAAGEVEPEDPIAVALVVQDRAGVGAGVGAPLRQHLEQPAAAGVAGVAVGVVAAHLNAAGVDRIQRHLSNGPSSAVVHPAD